MADDLNFDPHKNLARFSEALYAPYVHVWGVDLNDDQNFKNT